MRTLLWITLIVAALFAGLIVAAYFGALSQYGGFVFIVPIYAGIGVLVVRGLFAVTGRTDLYRRRQTAIISTIVGASALAVGYSTFY